jgi:hypothetical protein
MNTSCYHQYITKRLDPQALISNLLLGQRVMSSKPWPQRGHSLFAADVMPIYLRVTTIRL